MKVIFKFYIFTLFVVYIPTSLANDLSLAKENMQNYIQALKNCDTRAMADLMHPDALKRFRSIIDSALTGPKSKLAEEELLPLFRVKSLPDYYSLSDREAYYNMNEVIAASAPELIDMMKNAQINIISLNNQDELIYVIYSLGLEVKGQEVSKEVVQKMKLHDEQWMLMLSAEAAATVARINARYK